MLQPHQGKGGAGPSTSTCDALQLPPSPRPRSSHGLCTQSKPRDERESSEIQFQGGLFLHLCDRQSKRPLVDRSTGRLQDQLPTRMLFQILSDIVHSVTVCHPHLSVQPTEPKLVWKGCWRKPKNPKICPDTEPFRPSCCCTSCMHANGTTGR